LIADPERVLRAHEPCVRAGIPILAVRQDELQPAATNVHRWNEVLVRGVPMPEVEMSPDDDATILYTSGTTGFPKGAVSTHRAITNAVMAFASNASVQSMLRTPDQEGGGNPPCFILIVPLFHVTGNIPVMLSSFTWHFKLVMMYRCGPRAGAAAH
jgi:long-chain acyl-CoA synthetase